MAIEAATATHDIVHYEIPASDPPALARFYGNVFGWKFGGAPGMEEYLMAQAAPDGSGIAIYKPENDGARPVNYISVESIKAYVAKVQEHGGKLLHTFSVEHMGHGALTLDPQGNMLGLWQMDPTATAAWQAAE
jgi:uncharacterized protein